jgi:hypothetical protein
MFVILNDMQSGTTNEKERLINAVLECNFYLSCGYESHHSDAMLTACWRKK